jgi:hypothetical protein
VTMCVTFPAWTATQGSHAVLCSTRLATDLVKSNDKFTGSVTVPGRSSGWTAKNPVPGGARAIKDGGWLAYDKGKAKVYASRGNRSPDFFVYEPDVDLWGACAPWRLGTEGKMPYRSSKGCADGDGHVYASKGNNTSAFWLYDAGADVWTQKKDVPLGLSNKKLKGGSDMVWADNGGVEGPYLLKGWKNEFYRYDVHLDSWRTLTPAPIGADGKWDKGSWLAYDDANKKIYAFKARYMEFYRYSPYGDSWSAALTPMPAAGSAGSKKAKDGSCGTFINGSIYALKGGGIREFWKYTIATNSWTEKETIPTGLFKKKVKAGADIVTVGDVLYATKGNKSNEFWMYTPSAFMFDAPRPDGVEASSFIVHRPSFIVCPSPLAGGFVHLAVGGTSLSRPALIRLYDAAGRCVGVWKRLLENGSTDLDLRHLATGVYLVRIEADGFTTTQKLVVQR